MIASQTTGTPSVVKPLGRCTLYIVDRTDLAALATTRTDISIDGELPVGNHALVEILADDIGEETGCRPLVEFLYATNTVLEDAGHMFRLLTGLFYLLVFAAFGIGIHEWQADVAFGHDDGE